MKNYPVLSGDCLEVLKELPDNSVDSLVTDPPYGLSFMGKRWDYDVPSVDVWRECLRVLKPGGHALIACGTRTQHRMVVNIEDAGFEIRDVVTWLYGQGFPKSLDISKALDKAAGAEREVVGQRDRYLDGKTRQNLGDRNQVFGAGLTANGVAEVTAPATDAAKTWSGWGTALKPACEFWTLARKPLSEKNVAANVLKHGTGGINVDGCRIEVEASEMAKFQGEWDRFQSGAKGAASYVKQDANYNLSAHKPTGRFPANLVLSCACEGEAHDEVCAVRMLDEQSGMLHTHAGKGSYGDRPESNAYGRGWKRPVDQKADSGGASRFFYCAKVSPSERGEGNKHPTVKPLKLMRYLCKLITPPGGLILDPFTGSGSTGVAAKQEGFQFLGIEREPEYVAIAEKRIEVANVAELEAS